MGTRLEWGELVSSQYPKAVGNTQPTSHKRWLHWWIDGLGITSFDFWWLQINSRIMDLVYWGIFPSGFDLHLTSHDNAPLKSYMARMKLAKDFEFIMSLSPRFILASFLFFVLLLLLLLLLIIRKWFHHFKVDFRWAGGEQEFDSSKLGRDVDLKSRGEQSHWRKTSRSQFDFHLCKLVTEKNTHTHTLENTHRYFFLVDWLDDFWRLLCRVPLIPRVWK